MFISDDLVFLLNNYQLQLFCFLLQLAKEGVNKIKLPACGELFEDEDIHEVSYILILRQLQEMGLINYELDEHFNVHFEILPSAYSEYLVVDMVPWQDVKSEQTVI